MGRARRGEVVEKEESLSRLRAQWVRARLLVRLANGLEVGVDCWELGDGGGLEW